jgi:hypothetical protein
VLREFVFRQLALRQLAEKSPNRLAFEHAHTARQGSFAEGHTSGGAPQLRTGIGVALQQIGQRELSARQLDTGPQRGLASCLPRRLRHRLTQ